MQDARCEMWLRLQGADSEYVARTPCDTAARRRDVDGRFAPVGSGLEEASHRRRDVNGRFAPVSPGLEEAGCIDVRLRLTSHFPLQR